MQYISELISIEEMSKWKRGDSVLISAGTGKGKSHFILNTLRDFAESRNEKILLLVPRTAIKTQFNQQLDPFDTTIIVETYQWLETRILTSVNYCLEFDYIVADESHYFMDDSGFNEGTGISFEFLLKSPSVKIFMSATGTSVHALFKQLNTTNNIIEYNIEETFSHIEKLYFYPFNKKTKYSYIHGELTALKETDEKALIFINNVKEAEKLARRFPNDSILLHSGKDSIKIIEKLMEYEYFDRKFLITTSLLDTGVTFKDLKLKHIFVDHVNINSIIQMIGRKRPLNHEDTVTVYIRDFNNRSVNGMLSVNKRQLKPLEYCHTHGYGEFLRKYPFGKINNKSVEGIVSVGTSDGGYVIKINPLFYANLKLLNAYYQNILQNKNGFKGVVAKMLNKEENYEEVKIEDKRAEIIEYLRTINDERLYTKKQKDELLNVVDAKLNQRPVRTPAGLTGYFSEINIPCTVYSQRDSRRVITDVNGKQIPNPNRFKTFWRIWLEEGSLEE